MESQSNGIISVDAEDVDLGILDEKFIFYLIFHFLSQNLKFFIASFLNSKT